MISTDGNFSDVFCDWVTGKGYALTHYNSSSAVVVFTIVDDTWVIESEIPLEYSNSDRLCVHRDRIYISSDRNNCVYIYSNEGELLSQAGELGEDSPGKLICPELSCVDGEGAVLLADYGNNRLHLYSPDTREWCMLRMDEEPVEPRQAVVGDGGKHIWVTTDK